MLNIVNSLAFHYHSTGRYEEAEPLYRRALEGMERTLGPEHPTTFVVRGNLDAVLEAQEPESRLDALWKFFSFER